MNRALVLLAFACSAEPRVLSGYGSSTGVHGARDKPHAGVDYAGAEGDPVIAPAPGVVVETLDDAIVGKTVLLGHGMIEGGVYQVYSVVLHLSGVNVSVGDTVARGDVLGALGATGKTSGGVPHVHFQLCSFACARGTDDGVRVGVLDPGQPPCFEAEKQYDGVVFTAPVRC